MGTQPPEAFSEEMLNRVCCEFAEMPGLQLTSKQAQRLWGLDEQTCALLLNVLVEAKFLCLTGDHKYARSAEGPIGFPRPRMAKALLHHPLFGMKDVV